MELINSQKCKVLGIYLNYFREGKGDTVILVHGITTYSFIWNDLFHALRKDFDVIAIDLLGCGSSDKPIDVDYSIKNQANIIKEFLDVLNIHKVHIIGHDIGGGIAQIFTVRFPRTVLSSTFINSVAYDFWPVQPIIAMRTPIVRQLAMATLDLGMFRLIVQRGVYYKKKVTAELMNYFFEPMREKAGRKAFLHLASCLNNQNLVEITKELRQVKTPTLIIRGDADIYLASVISKKLHDEIPGSKLVIVPDAGHFIQIDVPDKLTSIINSFLKNPEDAK